MLKLISSPKGMLSVLVKNGNIVKIWGPGKRWVWTSGHVYRVKVGRKVLLPNTIDLRANLEVLKPFVKMADLKDSEVGVVLRNGVFEEVLTPGLHVYWKGLEDLSIEVYATDVLDLPESLSASMRGLLTQRGFIRLVKVEHGEKGLLLVEGKLSKVLEPGNYFYWNNPLSVQLLKAEMKRRSIELNGQELLSRDKATLRINLLAEMRIVDPELAVLGNANYEKQAYHLLTLALRAYVAALTLDELLGRKLEVAAQIKEATVAKFRAIGLELIEVGIRDIILPGEMREIMNRVLIAEKQAQANLITRREETASTRSLMNTAKLMENNPMLWKLKEMEYLEKVVEKVGTINVSGGQLGTKLRELFSSG